MKTITTLLLGALVVFAWGPWVDGSFITNSLKEASKKSSEESRTSEPCTYKRVISASRTAFGYSADVEYACFAPDPMHRKMFISSFGTVHPLSKLKKIDETE